MSTADVLPHLSNTERYIIAKNKVNKEHTITDWKLSPIGSVTGYLGEYFHVEMTITEKTGETNKHKFFMKTMPIDGWQTEFLSNDRVFEKEVYFYSNLSVSLRKFLSTDVYPECFLAVPGKIVLADAALQGYRPLKDLVAPLDYEHTKHGLIALARLHAGSIIYEEKTGRKIGSDFPNAAREVSYKRGSLGMDFLETGSDAIAALAPHLETNLATDPEAVALFQQEVKLWMQKLEYYLNEELPHRQVICHGDSWPANFLYRYDDQETPLQAMLIDFQMMRVRSPAVDVNTFMYLSVPADDLKLCRGSLLDAYYQVIFQEMNNCGLDADAIYPKEEFVQACIFYQIVGVIYGLLFFPFSRIRPDKVAEAISTKEKAFQFYYRDRKQHLIKWYKECPLLRRFLNGVTDELYENFIKSKRGLTEFTH